MISYFKHLDLRTVPVVMASTMLAIIPAAPASSMMILEICDPYGQIRTVSIPLEKDDRQDPDCAKPCHACLSRKAAGRQGSRSN